MPALCGEQAPPTQQHQFFPHACSARMKKAYQAKKVPACPRCEDIAAWKHDAKGRWWCKTCNKAFTPGITGANLTPAGRTHALKRDLQKQDAMRLSKNKIKEEDNCDAMQVVGALDGQAVVKEEANGIARKQAKNQSQILEYCPSPSSSANKIRKLTARRNSEKYKRIPLVLFTCADMLAEGDETSQEAFDEQGEGGDDSVKAEGMKVKSERPKKAPYACPHTDKPYYAKGKCRPCYWAEWRREGGKKGKYASDAQTSFDAGGTSPEMQKFNKRKKKSGSFTYETLVSQPKRAVAMDDAQCVAFRLNKASDYQAIHDLLLELKTFYITGEILKGSHLLLVVKRLTQNPSAAVSDLAKALFDEFAEILNEQRGSGENSPMSVTNDSIDSDGISPDPSNTDNSGNTSGNATTNIPITNANTSTNTNTNTNQFLQANILQQNYISNTNVSAFQPNVSFGSIPNYSTTFQVNNLQNPSALYGQQKAFLMQNQSNPAFSKPTPQTVPPANSKTSRQRQATNSQPNPAKAPFIPQYTFVPLSSTLINPASSQITTTNPLSSSMPIHTPGSLHMASTLSTPLSPPPTLSSPPLPSSTPANQLRLVQEITMMNNALAHLTNMNYNMLSNLNTMRGQNTIQPGPNFPAANNNNPNLGPVYVTNPATYNPLNYSYPMGMPNFVQYNAAPFDASLAQATQQAQTQTLQTDAATEIDPAKLVESMLCQDDDDEQHTLECTDYNHSPLVTNFMAGEEAISISGVSKAGQATIQPTTSAENVSRDNFVNEMTNDSCSAQELELSDNYLTFLA